VQDGIERFGDVALLIGIVNAEDVLPPMLSGE
jgi:hypothetical protein